MDWPMKQLCATVDCLRIKVLECMVFRNESRHSKPRIKLQAYLLWNKKECKKAMMVRLHSSELKNLR